MDESTCRPYRIIDVVVQPTTDGLNARRAVLDLAELSQAKSVNLSESPAGWAAYRGRAGRSPGACGMQRGAVDIRREDTHDQVRDGGNCCHARASRDTRFP
jgi:hypothetical protein